MKLSPTIIITGANGFIGLALVSRFSTIGYKVIALVHHLPIQKFEGVIYQEFDLSKQINEELFNNADILIHCAYVKHSDNEKSFEININGSNNLIKISRLCGIKKNIFLSSLSARKDSLSEYGKQKYAIEQLFKEKFDLILRPGLVIGNGGLVRDIVDFIKKKKVVPVINGGKQPIQTIYINDLINAIDIAINENLSGEIMVADPNYVFYKDFYRAIFKHLKISPRFIYLPYHVISLVILLAKAIGLKLPINKDNLLGLMSNYHIDTSEDLKKINLSLRTYKESISLTNFN